MVIPLNRSWVDECIGGGGSFAPNMLCNRKIVPGSPLSAPWEPGEAEYGRVQDTVKISIRKGVQSWESPAWASRSFTCSSSSPAPSGRCGSWCGSSGKRRARVPGPGAKPSGVRGAPPVSGREAYLRIRSGPDARRTRPRETTCVWTHGRDPNHPGVEASAKLRHSRPAGGRANGSHKNGRCRGAVQRRDGAPRGRRNQALARAEESDRKLEGGYRAPRRCGAPPAFTEEEAADTQPGRRLDSFSCTDGEPFERERRAAPVPP